MAFQYETGTADDVADWFSKLETFLVAVGWTVASGGGTTTVVFNSVGEAGGRTQLYIRFRQSTGNVYYRVQDDAGATHSTTEGGTYAQQLLAPGGGDVEFYYWMCATKDMVSVAFKAGDSYRGCYVGLVKLFPASAPYEECEMISVGLHTMSESYFGFVLRRHTGTDWNKSLKSYNYRDEYLKCPLDDSFPLLSVHAQYYTYKREAIGQLYNVTGRINVGPGLNPEDIITSGFAGATSTWIILGTGLSRWAMRTGGTLPTGSIEGAHFAHQTALANTIEAMVVNIKAFLTAVGWTEYANPSPEWPIDFYMYSPGEDAGDDIWVRMYYETNKWFVIRVMDDGAGTHENGGGIGYGPGGYLTEADFPTYYWITADRDCLVLMIENEGALMWLWAGMLNMANPDPAALDTPYKLGVVGRSGPTTIGRILRAHEGTWGGSTGELYCMYSNSSPSYIDGITNMLWPALLECNIANCVIGFPRYIYRLSGLNLAGLDTVAVGGRLFRWIPGIWPDDPEEGWAVRIA